MKPLSFERCLSSAASIDSYLVATRFERLSDRHVGVDVAGKCPQGEQEPRHYVFPPSACPGCVMRRVISRNHMRSNSSPGR